MVTVVPHLQFHPCHIVARKYAEQPDVFSGTIASIFNCATGGPIHPMAARRDSSSRIPNRRLPRPMGGAFFLIHRIRLPSAHLSNA